MFSTTISAFLLLLLIVVSSSFYFLLSHLKFFYLFSIKLLRVNSTKLSFYLFFKFTSFLYPEYFSKWKIFGVEMEFFFLQLTLLYFSPLFYFFTFFLFCVKDNEIMMEFFNLLDEIFGIGIVGFGFFFFLIFLSRVGIRGLHWIFIDEILGN